MASAKRLWHQKPGVFELAKLAEEAFRQPIHDVQRRSADILAVLGTSSPQFGKVERLTELEISVDPQARKPVLLVDRTAGVLARSSDSGGGLPELADAAAHSCPLRTGTSAARSSGVLARSRFALHQRGLLATQSSASSPRGEACRGAPKLAFAYPSFVIPPPQASPSGFSHPSRPWPLPWTWILSSACSVCF